MMESVHGPSNQQQVSDPPSRSREPMLVDELLRRRRESNTIRQRRRRGQLKSDSNELKLQIWRLQNEFDALVQHHATTIQEKTRDRSSQRSSSSILPWKDVAAALLDHRRCADDENKALRRHENALSTLVPALHAWVTSAYLPSSPYLRNASLSLNATPLLAHPACRQQGLDWLTKLMHANTELLLTKYRSHTPVTTDVSSNVVVDTTSSPDGSLTFVWQFHAQVNAPLEFVLPRVRTHIVEPLSGTSAASSPPTSHWTALDTELLTPDMTYMQYRAKNGKTLNRLYRTFTDGRDRAVVVGQSIPVDERFPSNGTMTKSMTWVVVDRIDDNRSMVRLLSTSSQAFTASGPVSIEQEATMRHCNIEHCPEPQKIDSLINQYCAAAPLSGWAQLIAEAATAAVHDKEVCGFH